MDEVFAHKYIWHDDKNQLSIEKHGLSFQSAAIALQHGQPVQGAARDDGRRDVYCSLNGETIKVVYENHGALTRIISAHKQIRKKRDLFAEIYQEQAALQGIAPQQQFNADYDTWRLLDREQKARAQPALTLADKVHRAEVAELSSRTLAADNHANTLIALEMKQQATMREHRQTRMLADRPERATLASHLGYAIQLQPSWQEWRQRKAVPTTTHRL